MDGEDRVVERVVEGRTGLFHAGGEDASPEVCRGAARDIELDLWTVVFLQL